MFSPETISLLTSLGTILLAIAAFVGIFYPRILLYWLRPRLKLTPALLENGKEGLQFKITNTGRSPSHNTIATIGFKDESDVSLGIWSPPWKLFSGGFPGVSNGLTEATYVGVTVYPGQTLTLRGIELIDIPSTSIRLMGLNAPPYLMGFGSLPSIFWAISSLPNSITAPLKANKRYRITVSLFYEETKKKVTSKFVIAYDSKLGVLTLLK